MRHILYNKFYKLTKQTIYRYQTNYMNRRNKTYIPMEHNEQHLQVMNKIFTKGKQNI